MKIITKIRKMGEKYYIPIPKDVDVENLLNKNVVVNVEVI